MAEPATRSSSMPPANARSACDTCRAPNGRCGSRSIIRASLTGRPMRQTRSAFRNTKPGPHQTRGAVREGGALLQGLALQGLARCGHCGRRLHTHYRGRNASPGYHCAGKVLVENRGVYCLNIGGIQIDEAVTRTFVAALEPAGLAATLAAAERLEVEREAALKQWRLGGRASQLRGATRRASLSRCRSRQPAGGARPRTRLGGAPA